MPSTEPRTCTVCGAVLSAKSPGSQCARCLLGVALDAAVAGQASKAIAARLPRNFDGYELLEEISRGGMGVVFKARQLNPNRIVALKMIRGGELANEAELARFRNEAEAAGRLVHPNIVSAWEVGECEGQLYFTMRLVEGSSLEQHLPHFGRDPRAAAALVSQVARAVHYAHERGVLHRDLKPSNILLDADGRPHITDFGLAKLIELDYGLTLSGAVIGTPAYIAPEQAAGRVKELTTTADVYSLGAVLYALLTGHPPFCGGSTMETLSKVIGEEPVPPSRAIPEEGQGPAKGERSSKRPGRAIDRDLDVICLKCLGKDPKQRYASARDLAEDLERWLRHEPILARRASAAERLGKWMRRSPAVAMLSAVALGLFAAGLVGVVWQWRRAEANTKAEATQRQRAEEVITRLELERAESLFAADNRARALAYLARLFRQQPTNQVVVERMLSALGHGSFCLPVARLQHDAPLEIPTDATRALCGFAAYRLPIRGGQFSSDGRRLVTFSEDGTARLWDGLTGKAIGEPLRHERCVMWAEFSADNRRLLTSSLDGSARLWDAHSGQPLLPPMQHSAAVLFAAFTPDARHVVSSSLGGSLRWWEVDTGQPVGPTNTAPAPAHYISFGSGGNGFLVLSQDGVWLHGPDRVRKPVWFSHDMNLPGTPFPRWSPDGLQFATFFQKEVSIRDAAMARTVATFGQHEREITSVGWSPDGTRLVTASSDQTARIWDARTGEPLSPPLRHDSWTQGAEFSSDGEYVVTGSWEGMARIWDGWTGGALGEPIQQRERLRIARCRPGGERLLTIPESNTAWLWDVRLNPPVSLPLRHGQEVRHAAFSPDGRRIVTACGDGKARIWDARTGELLLTPLAHERSLSKAGFSANGRRLFTVGGTQGGARVWDAVSGKPLTRLLWDRSGARFAWLDPSGGRLLLAAGSDPEADVWDVSSGTIELRLRHAGNLRFAAFSKDGGKIVSCAQDKTARVWDARTGQPLTPPMVHDDVVEWADFDPEGTRVVTASLDKTARVWDARTGRMLFAPLSHTDELGGNYSVEFSADGRRLATAAGNVARVWDAATGRSLISAIKHGDRINSVRFSPDGLRMVTACMDGTARLWDSATGHAISEPLRHSAVVHYAEFSPDGRRVVTASRDKTARIWDLPSAPLPAPDWLPELAEAVAGQRIDGQEMSRSVPVADLFELKRRLQIQPEDPLAPRIHDPPAETAAGSAHPDFYRSWADWFFSETKSRTLSPWSSVSIGEYVRQCAKDKSDEALQDAARLAPSNAVLVAQLASRLAGQKSIRAAGAAERARWMSQRALALSPGEPEVWLRHAEVLGTAGQAESALAALRRMLEMNLTGFHGWKDAVSLLEQVGMTEESWRLCDRLITLASDSQQLPTEAKAALFRQRADWLVREGRIEEARADFTRALNLCPAVEGIPPRDPQAGPHLIDLSAHYNASLTENRAYCADRDDWSYQRLPTGLQEFGGVRFDVRGIVQTGYETADGKVFPMEVRGIPVGQRALQLHFLHAAAAGKWLAQGASLGHYLVRYEDDSEEKIHLVLAQTLGHCRIWPREHHTTFDLVWLDPDEKLRQAELSPRLFKTTWINPHPDRRIRTIDLISTWRVGGPFVVAVTIEPAG